MYHLIETREQLHSLLEKAKDDDQVLAVDTEFLRERTYFAQLCLIQIGIGDEQYCIDVIALAEKEEGLQDVVELFLDPKICKVFHSLRQDFEVLWQAFATLPKPVFDTQLAAAFCGMDLQIGYSTLVEKMLGVETVKSQARTDWSRRPLSNKQLEYAAADVEHLSELAAVLQQNLAKADRGNWMTQELDLYYDTSLYSNPIEEAHLRLSGARLSIDAQYRLRALAQWREKTAQERNKPRSWIVNDDLLYSLARQQKLDLSTIPEAVKKRYLSAIQAVLKRVVVGDTRIWKKRPMLDSSERKLCKQIAQEIKSRGQELALNPQLLATNRDIHKLVRRIEPSRMLSGWRRECILDLPSIRQYVDP